MGDSIIRVDRSILPSYPRFLLRQPIVMPEFETTGPSEFDLADIEPWIHPEQKRVPVVAQTIWNVLADTGALRRCLNLRDGEEIQKKGLELYREFFAGRSLFLWKSIMINRHTRQLRIPYLFEYNAETEHARLVIAWLATTQHLAGTNNPIAHFPQQEGQEDFPCDTTLWKLFPSRAQ